jgi:diacylglycerol kinase family enzyme
MIVSNNPYALHRPLVTGTRPSLTSGQLGILVLDGPDVATRAGREPGRAWTATSLELDAPGPVHAGVDGEYVELRPPLEFVIVPAALRVRISSRHPGVSPSGLVTR